MKPMVLTSEADFAAGPRPPSSAGAPTHPASPPSCSARAWIAAAVTAVAALPPLAMQYLKTGCRLPGRLSSWTSLNIFPTHAICMSLQTPIAFTYLSAQELAESMHGQSPPPRFFVSGESLALPVAFSSGGLFVYALPGIAAPADAH